MSHFITIDSDRVEEKFGIGFVREQFNGGPGRRTLEFENQMTRVFDFGTEQVFTTKTGSEQWLCHNFNEIGMRSIERAHEHLANDGGDPPPLRQLAMMKAKSDPLKLG